MLITLYTRNQTSVRDSVNVFTYFTTINSKGQVNPVLQSTLTFPVIQKLHDTEMSVCTHYEQ